MASPIPVLGMPGYEADDGIGTLAATALRPVDVVTDPVLRQRYGVAATPYADFATLRGDPSDGLPGLAGIGEKTAARLLTEFGDLDGLLAAVSDPAARLSASIRATLRDGAGYLERARQVVAVARDLTLPRFDAAIAVQDAGAAELARLAGRGGLGRSADRALAAIRATA